MNWKDDIFLNDRIGLAFFWSWRIFFVLTTVLFLDAIMGNPKMFLFITSLLLTMTSELLYQVYKFKVEHYFSASENMEQSSKVHAEAQKNGYI